MLIDTLKWRWWDKYDKKIRYDAHWPVKECPSQAYMANTGLLDANGKEIWEGDILFVRDFHDKDHQDKCFFYHGSVYRYRGSVRLLQARGACLQIDKSGGGPYDDYNSTLVVLYGALIVGNIHETPELLNTRICTKCKTLKVGETFSIRYSDKPCGKCEEHHRNLFNYPVQPFAKPSDPLPPTMGEIYVKQLPKAELLGAKIEALVFDECAVTRPAKPKTIEAFQLPDADDWETDTFDKWALKRGLAHQDMQVAPATWEDWSGPYRKKSLQIFNDDNTKFRAYAGQWIIKEGDTWRVADSLESDEE